MARPGTDSRRTRWAASCEPGTRWRPIIGVMPEGFGFPNNQQLWMPLVDTAGAARSIAAQSHADREAPAGSIEGAGPCGSRRDRAAVGGGVSGQRGSWREGSHVSRAAERRAHPHRVPPDAGRRGLRAAHCLRQRGQHDAEPRAGPGAGDVGPRGDGRLALADGPATAAWKPCCSVSSEERPV